MVEIPQNEIEILPRHFPNIGVVKDNYQKTL